jgi:plasmid maintenance system antidote protein VapI
MSQLTKMNQLNGQKPMPHAGKLLQQVMQMRGIRNAELARRLDIHPIGITQYLKQNTLHAALLWKLGLVLDYNFFVALSNEFPIAAPSAHELQLQQQVINLQMEIDIYQKVLQIKGTGV